MTVNTAVTCENIIPSLIEAMENEHVWGMKSVAYTAAYAVAFANENCEGFDLKAREKAVRRQILALFETEAFGKRSKGYRYARAEFANGFLAQAKPTTQVMILNAANVEEAANLLLAHWSTDHAEDCFDIGSTLHHYGVNYGRAKTDAAAPEGETGTGPSTGPGKGKGGKRGNNSTNPPAPEAPESKAQTPFLAACEVIEKAASEGTLTADEATLLAEYLAAFVEGGATGAAEYKRLLAEAKAKPAKARKPRKAKATATKKAA